VATEKEATAMPNLTAAIERAARDFALSIIGAVQGATLQELLALQAPASSPRRGRPPKAEPGKAEPGGKPGRPPKATAKKATKRKVRKRIKWPKCKARSCTKNAWARGNGYCGAHAKAAKAK
jgi:hypothetical protein